jgi:PIN domain nuclease of toxin-antitoxin system
LLDTCAVIFIAEGQSMSPGAKEALARAMDAADLLVSPISAWEIGLLVARERIALPVDPLIWFQTFVDRPGVALAQMPPTVLMASSFLPGTPPSDPADRIVAATARSLGLRVMTRDRKLLDYAEAGNLDAVAC